MLTDPTDNDDDDGELTTMSKLSSVELIDVLLNCSTLSMESMLLLIDEQQLSSMADDSARVTPVLLVAGCINTPLSPAMNRFTSRSGLSIDVDEIVESLSMLLGVEGGRVYCIVLGVGGMIGVTIVVTDFASGGMCCDMSCGSNGCCLDSTVGEELFAAIECC